MTATLPGLAARPRRLDLTARARRDSAVRAAWGVALWLSLLLVTVWWVEGGGIADLGSWRGTLISLGRLSGLLGSDLLLVQVLLIARVPWLEGPFGQDRLLRLHRVVGFSSFGLVVLHVVSVTWGYAGGVLTGWWPALWTLTTDVSGILLAVAGFGCIVAVSVLSIRKARGRLRYESWHLLHLYAYLGAGLALPHQLWTGQELSASSAATAYWWSLWALALVAVLVFRVGLPLRRSLRHRLQVTSVVRESSDTVSVYLAGKALDRLPVEAGQFLTWRFGGRPGRTRGHPYSLSAAPDGRSLRITVKASGDASHEVATLTPGTPAYVEGPYGRLSARSRTRRRVALLGAGVGIAPLRALVEGMGYAYGTGEAVLLQRSSGEPLFVEELEVLRAERGFDLVRLTGPRRFDGSWLPAGFVPDDAHDGRDSAVLATLVPDIAERDLYLCGPPAWVASVRRSALAAGVPPAQIHSETFSW